MMGPGHPAFDRDLDAHSTPLSEIKGWASATSALSAREVGWVRARPIRCADCRRPIIGEAGYRREQLAGAVIVCFECAQ